MTTWRMGLGLGFGGAGLLEPDSVRTGAASTTKPIARIRWDSDAKLGIRVVRRPARFPEVDVARRSERPSIEAVVDALDVPFHEVVLVRLPSGRVSLATGQGSSVQMLFYDGHLDLGQAVDVLRAAGAREVVLGADGRLREPS
ncbi:MAG: hypothetical protein H6733_06990 [Alphaproteobacteria bacterium]|nr:hypothetical protein [Alphaproteobacteria bacterium]